MSFIRPFLLPHQDFQVKKICSLMNRNKKVISQPLLRFVETTIDHKKTNAWFFFCLSALLFINDHETKKESKSMFNSAYT